MKKKVLIISRFAPYDLVPHAGGKIHNYNIKKLNEENDFEIKLLSFCNYSDLEKIKEEKYNLDADIICIDSKNNINFKNQILDKFYRYIPIGTYGGVGEYKIKKTIINKLNTYKVNGYEPDIIILEWTQIIIYADLIKNIYKNSRMVGIEHDVTFQALERRLHSRKSLFKQKLYNIKFKKAKNLELQSLKNCDTIITLNEKDKNLLKENNIINNIETIPPYFQDFKKKSRNSNEKNILFYGKMDRKENYLSCIWFIENVFKDLIKLDINIKLYIVGYNPPEKLLKYQSNNIIITGFVENPQEYFEICSCFIAPLLLGGGIKIKVLEAMYAGLVVLTNNIGIEGIPVQNGKHYIHCEKSNEYEEAIVSIFNNNINVYNIPNNARKFLDENFSRLNGYKIIRDTLLKLL